MTYETLRVRSGDLNLAVYVSGPPDASPIVLVHGYPDSAAVWEPLRAQLETRYRVIAYDVRGAGASDAPSERAGYRLEPLADDLATVANATCGARPFHLVGHDWGSIQSWEAVTGEALNGRIASFTSISGPCLDHVAAASRDASQRSIGADLAQRLRSWYIVFFHLPRVPEIMWRCAGVRAWPLWMKWSESVDIDPDPAQLRNALNGLELYRANFFDRIRHPRPKHAHAPVLFIVPKHDRYVGPALSVGLDRWLGPYQREEIDAGHWVILRDPARIAASIDRFVTQHEPRADATSPLR
ncbi:alpha/beta fold hydrolase [Trinickia violacea]|uniref:Alpha/beta fold hydrolase n=1 Tax=Trinickia violacea TaxID=2571746 RepID=A0A4P8IX61_9BURK|nr:alpha/beta fold hydrolase [Trinickia violacea]QCP53968.1 alpha/beta fold hydrolase [Trinickia violacea]